MNPVGREGLLGELKRFVSAAETGDFNFTLNTEHLPSEDAEIALLLKKGIQHYRAILEEDIAQSKSVNTALGVARWSVDLVTEIMSFDGNKENHWTWSQEFRHILGFTDETDFPNRVESFEARLHPDDIEKAFAAFKAHCDDYTGKTPYDIEYRLLHKDGQYRYFDGFGVAQRNSDGVPFRVTGAVRDITDKKLAERRVDELNKNMAFILDSLPAGVRIVSLDDNQLVYANKASMDIFGCEDFERDVAGRSAFDFMPEVQPNGRKTVDMANEFFSAEQVTMDFECFTLHGKPFTARITSCIVNYKEKAASLAIIEDITTRKKMEGQLSDSDLRLNLLVKSLDVAMWDMTINADSPIAGSNEFWWSQEFRHMLGFSDESDFPNVLSSWSDRLHPEDKERILNQLAAHLNDYTGKTPLDFEYRLMLKNGDYRYFHAFGETLRDSAGVPIRVAGALKDVHEQKTMQKALKRREELLETLNTVSVAFLSQRDKVFGTLMSQEIGVIADMMGLDRLSVWRNTAKPDGLHASMIYRWDRDSGGVTEPTETLSDVSYDDLAPNWKTLFEKGATINGPARLMEEREAASLKAFGVVSAFAAPVFINHALWGFVLFEDRVNERRFDSESAEIMLSAAFLFVNAVIRDEKESEILEANQALDQQNDLLYAVNRAASALLTADAGETFRALLMEGMEIIGRSVDADCVEIWKNEMVDGELHAVNIHYWFSDRVSHLEPAASAAQSFPYSDTHDWENRLARGECIQGSLQSLLPEDQPFVESFGIKSLLVIPMFMGSELWGMCCIDDYTKSREFSEDEVSILRSMGNMMASTIVRQNLTSEIRKANHLTKILLDESPLCCQLWDSSLKKIDCNEAAVKLFGFKDKQDYLENYALLYPEYQPDGQPTAEKAYNSVKKAFDEGSFTLDWTYKLPDGTMMPTEITLIRVEYEDGHGVAGYTRDLREQKRMMDEIEQRANEIAIHKNTLQTMINSMPDFVFGKDLNCNYTLLNLSAATYLNVEIDSIIGKNDIEGLGFPAEVAEELLQQDKKIFSGEPKFIAEHWIPAHDGSLRYFETTKAPITQDGAIIGLVGVSRDITEKTQMKKELETALEQATAASKAKGEFLAKMSHEIRTPMNAIIGMTELALREDNINVIHEHSLSVKQAGSTLLSIINDILDFSKIEQGKLEIVSAKYNVSSLINDVISITRMKVIHSQLRFTVNIDCNIPYELIGDEVKIRQALINVLWNAVKYTDSGFVSLSVSGEITDGDTVELVMKVADSGRGIKQEDIGNLFGDFVQFESELSRNTEGVGLGLAITKSLVSAMGGRIDVESEYGKGSLFTLTLPQKFHVRAAMAAIEEPGKKVLLYEQNKTYADSVFQTLGNLGVHCDRAENDNELYEKLAAQSYGFVFISATLYGNNEYVLTTFGKDAKVVLLAKFGGTISSVGLKVLEMPAYCVSVANVLNNVSGGASSDGNGALVEFSAPDAKVLVVDDINTNLVVANGLLRPYNMRVDLCRSGMDALEAIKARRYDLVFMDHKMPRMDGVETKDRIRAMGDGDSYYKTVPIVALTANAVNDAKKMFLENGFDDFLAKPIDTVELNAILKKWIPKHKRERLD
ncbi:MAG: PAS domain-containing protein [Oscillospiraceae bacterium]|nr:PAS domain-containing protein [Oscillospiraceae bacterium]